MEDDFNSFEVQGMIIGRII